MGHKDYHLSDSALNYMCQQSLPQQPLGKLQAHQGQCFDSKEDWIGWLDSLLINNVRHRRIVTEATLLGSILHHGLCDGQGFLFSHAGR